MPPEHYESAVARAVERIRAGALDKIVLAREVQVHAPRAHDPAAVLGVLREAFPSCFTFCAGRGESAFVAASPELLVRRDGLRAGTLALAGSTRRSADPAVDDHLGEQLLRSDKDREEQAIVTRRIVRALRPVSVWVTAAEEPVVARMANIQHLATPIRAQLARPVSAVELAGMLHPTPAVGGEPFAAAEPLIPALEGLDRGWYAGPVGWTDANEDGEFCVALRCALLTGAGRPLLRGRRRRARLRPGGRAGRDRGQAAGAAAGPRRADQRPSSWAHAVSANHCSHSSGVQPRSPTSRCQTSGWLSVQRMSAARAASSPGARAPLASMRCRRPRAGWRRKSSWMRATARRCPRRCRRASRMTRMSLRRRAP